MFNPTITIYYRIALFPNYTVVILKCNSVLGWYIGDAYHQKCVKEDGCQAKYFKNYCHYVFNKSATWEENKQFCKTRNMTRVSIIRRSRNTRIIIIKKKEQGEIIINKRKKQEEGEGEEEQTY